MSEFVQPKLKRDWVGRHVRLLRDMQTHGGDMFQAGTVMRVIQNRGGLKLAKVKSCPRCAAEHRERIHKVDEVDVELLHQDYEPVTQPDEVLFEIETGENDWAVKTSIGSLSVPGGLGRWMKYNRPHGRYRLVLVREGEGE